MAKETKKAPKKAKTVETQEKPKTMAARRTAPTTSTRADVSGQVFRRIVASVLNAKTKTFTSTQIADLSNSSTRHSRRTLSQLTRQRMLTVERGNSRFEYKVAQRGRLRELVR